MAFNRFLVFLILILLCFGCNEAETKKYRCIPCGLPCDTQVHEVQGRCPECGMKLVPTAVVSDAHSPELNEGSGSFWFPVRTPGGDREILVFYHRPKLFRPYSRILIILPGAGRDGDEYRDTWIPYAEQYGILILAPMYPETIFGFEAYHLGGLVSDMNLREAFSRAAAPHQVLLDEDKLRFSEVDETVYWIFDDFDQLFKAVVKANDLSSNDYDLFGHSAGGQILHRLAIFYPRSGAGRIVASNSGFYTLPNPNIGLPFGVRGSQVDSMELRESFQKDLTIFLGQEDNASESRGTLLISTSANLQGSHRLERGRYFYNWSKNMAERFDTPFNWKIFEVPGVGHDFRKMSAAAAFYLYGTPEVDPLLRNDYRQAP